jgi:GNAT superfamily N-acetyltransferase
LTDLQSVKQAVSVLNKNIVKLSNLHDLDSFDSGVDACNEWLKKYALSSSRSHDAQVYVICRDQKLVGYYTLTASEIAVSSATKRAAQGLPRAGRVSAILIGQLAVDKTEQGRNIGKFLLQDALRKCAFLSESMGARVVMVHAIDDSAKQFYQKFDFEESPIDGLTMLLLMKDIKAALRGQ